VFRVTSIRIHSIQILAARVSLEAGRAAKCQGSIGARGSASADVDVARGEPDAWVAIPRAPANLVRAQTSALPAGALAQRLVPSSEVA
jgi:hypothetical protein